MTPRTEKGDVDVDARAARVAPPGAAASRTRTVRRPTGRRTPLQFCTNRTIPPSGCTVGSVVRGGRERRVRRMWSGLAVLAAAAAALLVGNASISAPSRAAGAAQPPAPDVRVD